MRTKLGTFQYTVGLADVTGTRFVDVDAWVDTGAHFSQFPSSLLHDLGYEAEDKQTFRLADGRVVESPVGEIRIRLGGRVRTVISIFAEEGSDALLGATALENFVLAADPVNKTLVPTVAHRLSQNSVNQLEEGTGLALDFDKLSSVAQIGGVLPCAVQNADTREVILIAYVNKQALRASIETRTAVFWSTSRNELWEKGKTSGETFDLLEVRVNCEQNSLVYVVRPRRGGICHTKNQAGEPRDCYYRRLDFETGQLANLDP